MEFNSLVFPSPKFDWRPEDLAHKLLFVPRNKVKPAVKKEGIYHSIISSPNGLMRNQIRFPSNRRSPMPSIHLNKSDISEGEQGSPRIRQIQHIEIKTRTPFTKYISIKGPSKQIVNKFRQNSSPLCLPKGDIPAQHSLRQIHMPSAVIFNKELIHEPRYTVGGTATAMKLIDISSDGDDANIPHTGRPGIMKQMENLQIRKNKLLKASRRESSKEFIRLSFQNLKLNLTPKGISETNTVKFDQVPNMSDPISPPPSNTLSSNPFMSFNVLKTKTSIRINKNDPPIRDFGSPRVHPKASPIKATTGIFDKSFDLDASKEPITPNRKTNPRAEKLENYIRHFDFTKLETIPCLIQKPVEASDSILLFFHANGEDIWKIQSTCEILSKVFNVVFNK